MQQIVHKTPEQQELIKTMKTNAKVFTETGTVAGAIGKGLLAGLAGTAAITASQMIEMAIESSGYRPGV